MENHLLSKKHNNFEKMKEIFSRETWKVVTEMMEKKLVWFIISENYGQYFITMFYDNEYIQTVKIYNFRRTEGTGSCIKNRLNHCLFEIFSYL